jgi:hypothetical protein
VHFDDRPRRRVQLPGSPVVAETLPRLQDLGLGRRCQGKNVGKLAEKPLEIRDDGHDGRLDQHHFGDEDSIRISVRAPGQVAPRVGIPGRQTDGHLINPRSIVIEAFLDSRPISVICLPAGRHSRHPKAGRQMLLIVETIPFTQYYPFETAIDRHKIAS